MASGHVNRTYRPNTWLHRPSLRREDFSCQPGAVHTWHEPHGCPGDGLADRLGICGIVLLPLDVGLHVGWRHQAHDMAESLEFARPIVRRGASLHANQAWWQPLEERQEVAPLQLPADDHLTSGINSVNLEDRLGNVETDCRDRLHG